MGNTKYILILSNVIVIVLVYMPTTVVKWKFNHKLKSFYKYNSTVSYFRIHTECAPGLGLVCAIKQKEHFGRCHQVILIYYKNNLSYKKFQKKSKEITSFPKIQIFGKSDIKL